MSDGMSASLAMDAHTNDDGSISTNDKNFTLGLKKKKKKKKKCDLSRSLTFDELYDEVVNN